MRYENWFSEIHGGKPDPLTCEDVMRAMALAFGNLDTVKEIDAVRALRKALTEDDDELQAGTSSDFGQNQQAAQQSPVGEASKQQVSSPDEHVLEKAVQAPVARV